MAQVHKLIVEAGKIEVKPKVQAISDYLRSLFLEVVL